MDVALVVDPDFPFVRRQADAVAQAFLAFEARNLDLVQDLAGCDVADLEADAAAAGVQKAACAGRVDAEGMDAAADRADLADDLVRGGVNDGEEIVVLGSAV